MFPKARCAKGVLEFLAQRSEVHYSTQVGAAKPEYHKRQVIAPPCVVERATASVLHAGVERGGVATADILEYLQRTRFCIINDIPDNASVMKRRQHHVAEQLAHAKP